MVTSQLLSRPNRIALTIFLVLSILMHIAIIILRFYMTIDRWDIVNSYRSDPEVNRGAIYQIVAIVLDTLLLPLLLWEFWTLIKRRLTYAAFLLYSTGWSVYWAAMIAVTTVAGSNVSEALSYGLLWYIFFIAGILGLYVAQMFWAIGVFVHDRKMRKTAETIPGGAGNISLKNMSGEHERA